VNITKIIISFHQILTFFTFCKTLLPQPLTCSARDQLRTLCRDPDVVASALALTGRGLTCDTFLVFFAVILLLIKNGATSYYSRDPDRYGECRESIRSSRAPMMNVFSDAQQAKDQKGKQ
jgi:hypothetical protein